MEEEVILRDNFIKLTCVCCGGTKFKVKQSDISDFTVVEGVSYVYQEDFKNSLVTCEHCGLEDYMVNLPCAFYGY